MSEFVLDASAALALLWDEPGAKFVRDLMTDDNTALMSSVNLSEVVAKMQERDIADERIREAVDDFAFETRSFDRGSAVAAGFLRRSTRRAGLSLGDRACLALGTQLGVPVLTTDRSWASLGLPVEVRVIR